jgi:hypothetical protein
MDVENEKGNFQKVTDVIINILGIVMIVYVTFYFFIALTD